MRARRVDRQCLRTWDGLQASQPRGSVTRRLEGLSASAARELLLRELRQGLAAGT